MKNFILMFTAIIGLIAVIAFLLGFPLMLLWNWLMPSLFNIREITFWEAIGINVMSGILLGKYNNFNKKSKE